MLFRQVIFSHWTIRPPYILPHAIMPVGRWTVYPQIILPTCHALCWIRVVCVCPAISTWPIDQSNRPYSDTAEQSSSSAVWVSVWYTQPVSESITYFASDRWWQRQRCCYIQTADLRPCLRWRGMLSCYRSCALLMFSRLPVLGCYCFAVRTSDVEFFCGNP